MAFRIHLEPRILGGFGQVLISPLAAIALALLLGAVLFGALGYSPGQAMLVYFVNPLRSSYGLAELLVKASPLALCAIGLAIAFRANVWNIGAEGQLTIGAIAGSALALAHPPLPSFLLLPAIMVTAAIAGAGWAAIPAWLKVRFGTNEVLTSLMLTYVALLLLSAMVHGPLRDPDGLNFPQSSELHEDALLPIMVAGSRLHGGIVLTVLVLGAAWFALSRHLAGFQVRVHGLAPLAVRYGGFSSKQITWGVFLLSGALAGTTGVLEIIGPIGRLQPVISPGYGFTAIIVAFLGRLHPVGIAFASILVALSYLGGEAAQIVMKMPRATTGVFQGILLFAVLACDMLARYRLRLTFSTKS